MPRAVRIAALVLAFSGVPVSAAAASVHVLAPRSYKPTRHWCPTNRACFSTVGWQSYSATQALGYGNSRECPGGGPTEENPCRGYTHLRIELSKPNRVCGALRFTRLRMFGSFYGLDSTCSVYQ
jgi:hypothetical protein